MDKCFFFKCEERNSEYWDRMRKIAQENPELPLHFLQDIILGQSEDEKRQIEPYNWQHEKWIYCN